MHGLRDPVQLLLGDADAVVRDGDPVPALLLAARELDGLSGLRCLAGVVDEVGDEGQQQILLIEYLILLVSEFASHNNVSEVQAYRYLSQYGALALCEKHYNIMHTLSVEDNMQTLQSYCQRKGGTL